MKNDEIRILLKRYYNGETTIAEEEQLHSFFNRGDVADEFKADVILFKACTEISKDIPIPEGWEKRLDEKLANKRGASSKRKERFHFGRISGIAATVLLVVSLGLYEFFRTETPVFRDTCATPEEAYQEAYKALLLFSTDLNNGLAYVENELSILEY